jgi:uncharacterized protein YdaU (DUF1376 family)
MAKEEAPAFQYYPRDYLSDSKVRAMSYKERGIYWELVSMLWCERVLPAKTDQLARILGLPHREFQRHWPAISACFRVVGENIEHGRLELERRKQQRFKDCQIEAGKRGAEKRYGKGRHSDPIATLPPRNGVAIGSLQAAYSSSSSSSSSVPPNPQGGGGGDDDGTNADTFWNTWREIHQRTQHGAMLSLQPRGREIQTLVDIVTAYPDMEHLARMAEVFMLRDDAEVRGKPKSLGLFLYHAPWCDAQLRRAGMAGSAA